jgi:hypothetical protein
VVVSGLVGWPGGVFVVSPPGFQNSNNLMATTYTSITQDGLKSHISKDAIDAMDAKYGNEVTDVIATIISDAQKWVSFCANGNIQVADSGCPSSLVDDCKTIIAYRIACQTGKRDEYKPDYDEVKARLQALGEAGGIQDDPVINERDLDWEVEDQDGI